MNLLQQGKVSAVEEAMKLSERIFPNIWTERQGILFPAPPSPAPLPLPLPLPLFLSLSLMIIYINSDMHFLLECQRFIEFIRERNPKNALQFAQAVLAPFPKINQRYLETMTVCTLYFSSLFISPIFLIFISLLLISFFGSFFNICKLGCSGSGGLRGTRDVTCWVPPFKRIFRECWTTFKFCHIR